MVSATTQKLGLVIALLSALGCGEEQRPMFFDNFRETELGTFKIVQPSPTFGNRGDYVKALELHAEDAQAAEVMFAFRTEYGIVEPVVSDAPPPVGAGTPLTGGPMVARVTWGVGGAYSQIEFDVPESRFPTFFEPSGQPTRQPVNDIGNGIVATFSGSSFTVELRNDGNLATLTASLAAGNNRIGIADPTGARCRTFAAPAGGAITSPLRRSIYVAGGSPNFPLAAGAGINVTVPSFAKRFYLFRTQSAATPFLINTGDSFGGAIRAINIGVNEEGPWELSPIEQTLGVNNLGAVAASVVLLVFDVNPY